MLVLIWSRLFFSGYQQTQNLPLAYKELRQNVSLNIGSKQMLELKCFHLENVSFELVSKTNEQYFYAMILWEHSGSVEECWT